MYKFIYLIFIIAFSISNSLLAQEKFEKESRIKKKEAPSKVLLFIDSLNFNTKIKWYKEEELTRKSIEVKFRQNKARYSIEFDTLGNIEDIEVEANWKDLESGIKNSVSIQLKLDCSRHKILKVQKQFNGNENDLFSFLKSGKISEHLKIKYEIIARCKQQKKVDLFEYLFNDKGQVISISKIVFRSSSHLEY
jgi:hypothetical protein